MNLATYLFWSPSLLRGTLLFNKVGWSPPSATPNSWTEPVFVINTDNTKVQIIIDYSNSFEIYFLIKYDILDSGWKSKKNTHIETNAKNKLTSPKINLINNMAGGIYNIIIKSICIIIKLL